MSRHYPAEKDGVRMTWCKHITGLPEQAFAASRKEVNCRECLISPCEKCGVFIDDVKCQTQPKPEHGESHCRFICPECDHLQSDGRRCLQRVTLTSTLVMPYQWSDRHTTLFPQLPPGVRTLIGDIILAAAIYERSMHYLLQNLPGHGNRSSHQTAMERLERARDQIINEARHYDEDLARAFLEAIEELVRVHHRAISIRNVIAHGDFITESPIAPHEGRSHYLRQDDMQLLLTVDAMRENLGVIEDLQHAYADLVGLVQWLRMCQRTG